MPKRGELEKKSKELKYELKKRRKMRKAVCLFSLSLVFLMGCGKDEEPDIDNMVLLEEEEDWEDFSLEIENLAQDDLPPSQEILIVEQPEFEADLLDPSTR